jgi:hypothetical protein
MPMRYSIIWAGALSTAVNGLAYKGPVITNIAYPAIVARNPEPTPPPSLHELLKRQNIAETFLVGPDNTCGYVSGLAGELAASAKS